MSEAGRAHMERIDGAIAPLLYERDTLAKKLFEVQQDLDVALVEKEMALQHQHQTQKELNDLRSKMAGLSDGIAVLANETASILQHNANVAEAEKNLEQIPSLGHNRGPRLVDDPDYPPAPTKLRRV